MALKALEMLSKLRNTFIIMGTSVGHQVLRYYVRRSSGKYLTCVDLPQVSTRYFQGTWVPSGTTCYCRARDPTFCIVTISYAKYRIKYIYLVYDFWLMLF
jgi:hypothetical protein